MSTESLIMMIVVLGGYTVGAYVLLSKVFKAQQEKESRE
jgi:hypothetical protein